VPVQDDHQINESVRKPYVSYVSAPDLVRTLDVNSFKKIGIDFMIRPQADNRGFG
jgi:hypothetical protein